MPKAAEGARPPVGLLWQYAMATLINGWRVAVFEACWVSISELHMIHTGF